VIRSVSKLSMLLAAWLLMLANAHGQSTSAEDIELARNLGREARDALARNDFARAEEQSDRALARHKAPTLYMLRGRARQGLGKLSAAIEDYNTVIELPVAPDENIWFQRARVDARTALERVLAQQPHLTLFVKGPVSRVLVNGVEWPEAAIGVDRALDPGLYAIEVEARHGASRVYNLSLALGEKQVLTLLPPTELAASPSESVAIEPVPLSPPPQPADHTLKYVLGATTLGLVIGSVVTGFIALERRATYHENNRVDVPLSTVQGLRSDAKTWGLVNTGLWAGAIVAGAATAYVVFVAPEATPETGISGVQLWAAGRF